MHAPGVYMYMLSKYINVEASRITNPKGIVIRNPVLGIRIRTQSAVLHYDDTRKEHEDALIFINLHPL